MKIMKESLAIRKKMSNFAPNLQIQQIVDEDIFAKFMFNAADHSVGSR